MPMYSFLCEKCQGFDEHFFHASELPNSLPCNLPTGEDGGRCDGVAKQTFEPSIALRRPSSWAQRFDPVVIHKDAAGNIRFPGSSDSPVPAGFEKVTLTDFHQVRKLEREMNARERSRAHELNDAKNSHFRDVMKQSREAVSHIVERMSPRGRRFYHAMREASDRRMQTREGRSTPESNFFLEAFSMDSSNRDAYRDERNGWGRDGRRK
jgi:hypothetical protein